MKRNFLIPSMSVCGVVLGLFVMLVTTKMPTKAASFTAPAKLTFGSFVSGSGLVESSSENLRLSSNTGGVVVGVFVQLATKWQKASPFGKSIPHRNGLNWQGTEQR